MKLNQWTWRGAFFALLLMVGGMAAVRAQQGTPDQIIDQVTEGVRLKIAKDHGKYEADKSAFYSMVDQELVSHVDTVYVAKVILGQHLKTATPDQVTRFETAFKNMLMRQYADKLLEYYDSVEIKTMPAKVASDGEKATVDTTIERPGKPAVPVVFSMRRSGGEWKVWDIKAENISLVLNFRTQIDSEIKKTSVSAVIDRLEKGELNVSTPSTGGKAS